MDKTFAPFPCSVDGKVIVGHWAYQNTLIYEHSDTLYLHEYLEAI